MEGERDVARRGGGGGRPTTRARARLIGTAALSVLALVTTSCATGAGDREPAADDPAPAGTLDAGTALTGAGATLAGDRLDGAPRYRLEAAVDPATGSVEGTVEADLPAGDAGEVTLRYFPALVDPGADVTGVSVGGRPAASELDGALLTVPTGDGESRVQVRADFSYEVPETATGGLLGSLDGVTGDEGPQPADIGLLGRSDGVVTLGHWFPVWVPAGFDPEPVPDGYGDIGNFPAATIEAEVHRPEGWTVVTGGTRLGGEGDRVVEGGQGLRDLALVLVDGAAVEETSVGPTTVRVVAGADTDPSVLDEVTGEAATSLEVLTGAFGPYPWSELEVVATPLGSGVGGMEWPGMVWIESGIFAGGLPGLGGLGDLDLGDLGDLDLGDLGDLDLGDLDAGDLDLGDLDAGDLDLGDLDVGDLGPGPGDTGPDGSGDLGPRDGTDAGDPGPSDRGAPGPRDPGNDTASDLETLLEDLLEELEAQGFDPEDLGLEDLTPGGLDPGDPDPGPADPGGDAGGLGDLGTMLDPAVMGSTRAWTVAHEVGHQWWHAVVGNDSPADPAVDEPLAQHSACLVFREAWPEDADAVCEANTAAGYRQMRLLGTPDAPADQPSDAFASPLQYSGVVYGKAPGLYGALANEVGGEALTGALATVVEDHAFDRIDGDGLRDALGRELDAPATVDDLWARWMESAHGDEDLGD